MIPELESLLQTLVIGGIVWGLGASWFLLTHEIIRSNGQLADYQLVGCAIAFAWYLLIAAITELIVLIKNEHDTKNEHDSKNKHDSMEETAA
jgi:hypothetical protein